MLQEQHYRGHCVLLLCFNLKIHILKNLNISFVIGFHAVVIECPVNDDKVIVGTGAHRPCIQRHNVSL